ncbi:MAG TPA: serine--tRNA ligase [Polyangiaceae bacterium]|nr:serine--tRNA ligase [Polyangiaceae bacterium]
MLDLRYVVDHLEEVKARLLKRGAEAAAPLAPIAEMAEERRTAIAHMEAMAQERNQANAEMAKLPKGGLEFQAKRESLGKLSGHIKELQKTVNDVEAKIEAILVAVPNLPDESVPVGSSEEDNPVVRTWGAKPALDFEPKAHWDIGAALGILDFDRASKISGPRFTFLVGDGARLSRAIIQFMLELHREHGYTEIAPPLLVKDSAMRGTGQLPKFAADAFKTVKADPEKAFDLYLIPTAEVPVTNYFADEILEGASLPRAFTAYTPCFRAEAGSYGKDVRGLIRQHQFDKVELVRFATPETSAAEHEKLTSHAEEVLKRLGLHYRVSELCTGDLGAGAKKTYDLEVWLPGQNLYREISSCSNFGDYQARRAQIRYRDEATKKVKLLHTLNGSALAVGRTMVAILEQFQQRDGTVVVPDALRPFLKEDVLRARK